jgi:hypothetical protein
VSAEFLADEDVHPLRVVGGIQKRAAKPETAVGRAQDVGSLADVVAWPYRHLGRQEQVCAAIGGARELWPTLHEIALSSAKGIVP